MFKFFSVILPILFILFGGSDIMGQSIALAIGGYGNVHRSQPPDNSLVSRSRLNHKYFGSLEIYIRPLIDSERFHRFGMRFQGTNIDAIPLSPSTENLASKEGISYRMGSILLNYQRKLVYEEPAFVFMNLSSGVTFFSSKLKSGSHYSDTPFGSFPATKFTLSGGFDLLLKLNKSLVSRLGARYTYFFARGEDIYPFSSGISIEIGFSLGNN